MQPAAAMNASAGRRVENLAIAFQELLTVGERLRSNRQAVADANTFRAQIRQAVQLGEAEARRMGYTAEDTSKAVFAVVAFIDESVLNKRDPMLADWPRRPIQEELFGTHVAGEVFFQNLKELLQRADSHDTADVLEVYQLCLLLGFLGRYSVTGREALQGIIAATGDKIQRIRRTGAELSPYGLLPQDAPRAAAADSLGRLMLFAALGAVALAVLVFVLYKVLLMGKVSGLDGLVAGVK